MKQTTDELKKIIADAPDGATHCDNVVSYYKMNHQGNSWGIFKGCWCVCVGCNTMRMPPSMRSLSDIKEIIELRERIEAFESIKSKSNGVVGYDGNLCNLWEEFEQLKKIERN